MDITTFLSTLPIVTTHPWILVLALPAFFWFAAHGWTHVVAPTATSNAAWKAIYPFVNAFIAANYGNSANAPIDQKLDAVLATVKTSI